MAAVSDIGISSTSNAAVGYFVDQKKGEVNELKQVTNFSIAIVSPSSAYVTRCCTSLLRYPQLLKNINVEKDVKRKRDVIKKVIAYMTLGIDVSRLFTDMIMVSIPVQSP